MEVERAVEYKGKVDMIGQLLANRYQIIRVLGSGGFSQTYVAQDTHIPGNPTCVVKHLQPASNSPSLLKTARELFQREAETLVKLGDHDQIPQLLAYFEEDQEFYLVQEFIEGHTLTIELPLGQSLPESQVIQLLEEILNILVFVHSQGVIHRDIKPDNIICRKSDNKLVLIDFGAIKQVQNQQISVAVQQQSVATSTRIGTPGYTPTEQDRGKPRPCSDIFALGMVGIQALTGVCPQHLQEDDETGEMLWEHQAQVSSGLAAILTKMVRYHFKDRYQSAKEALQALQQLKNPSQTPTLLEMVVDTVTDSVHPVAPTVQPLADQTVDENTTSSSSENQVIQQASIQTNHSFSTSNTSISSNKLPLFIGLGVAALVSVGGGYAYLKWQSNNSGTKVTSTSKLDSTVKSIPTDTSTSKSDSTATSTPTDTSTSKSDSTVQSNSTDSSTSKLDSTVQSNSTDSSTSKSDSTTKSSPKDTSTPKSDSTVQSNSTDSSTSKSDSTTKSSPKDTSTSKSDSTAKSSPTNTSPAKSDSTQPPRDHGPNILARATDKAKNGDFQRAIALAGQVPSGSSAHQQAQNAIAQWQQQQQQQQQILARQQAENRARSLLAKAKDIATGKGVSDLETAIRIAEKAIAKASPDSSVYKDAQNAIAQWQREATAKREQETAAPSYKCYCQSSVPGAQNSPAFTESESDLTGFDCAPDGDPETRTVKIWKCDKK